MKKMLTDATNELKTSVSEGKALVAAAVTDKGVSTAADATFQTMATNIGSIPTGTDTSDATATAAQILSGYTAYAKGVKLTGIASAGYKTMTFRNHITGSIPTLSMRSSGATNSGTVDISSGSITLYIYNPGGQDNRVTFTFS